MAEWSRDRQTLVAVMLATFALGWAYAVRTPPWQAPDEPAHFNVVAHVAASPLDLPRLEADAYSQATIEELTRQRFPAHLPIDSLRYEHYQPPLYYYLAAAAFRLAGSETREQLLLIRFLGVLLGATTVALAWQIARAVIPDDKTLAVASAAFVGFLPMRLAATAAASNDALAHPLAALALLLAVWHATGRLNGIRFVATAAAVMAAALLTKVSAAPAVVALAVAVVARWHTVGRGAPTAALHAIATLSAMLALAAVPVVPWLARNARVYGGLDVLGTRAHDRAVVGQPRTVDWIASEGLGAWMERFVVFTFQSFWGVFGWLAVFMDRRIYVALAAWSAVALLCGAGHVWRLWTRQAPAARRARPALAVLGLALALNILMYVAYNALYVQHQGRYLLVSLPVIALLLGLGVRDSARWTAAAVGLGGVRFAVGRIALCGSCVAMAGLAWLALVRYVVPGLS